MKNTLKSLLLTAAVSGLLSGAALAQNQNGTAAAGKNDQPKAEKNSCNSRNGCGAKSDNTAANKQDAKDKNSCAAHKTKDKNSCSAHKGSEVQTPPSA